jgi:hypothetical protein
MSMGKDLGGRPDGERFYDPEGYVLYSRVARERSFRKAIERLGKGVTEFRVAIMCGEEDPYGCHRRLLVGRVLRQEGVEVQHIRQDGRLQTDPDVEGEHKSERVRLREKEGHQLEISFKEGATHSEEAEWKSLRSVLRKAQPSDSSED